MIKVENFDELVDLAMRGKERAHMRPVIAKELLHYDILFTLDKEGLLDQLTFQGGTALRLCYGAVRFSEDLDFVGGYDFSTTHLLGIKECLEQYIGKRYGLEIQVKEPKETALMPQYKDIKVDKWQVSITTSPERKDLPKQKIKLEVANIPAYSHTAKALKKNYNFLPDGYSDIVIITESLDEIFADKIVSLVGCQRYIRYRDIWDLRWLKQQGATINAEYFIAKLHDYKEDHYLEKLEKMIGQVDLIVQSQDFMDLISRFIPIDVQERTLKKNKFLDLVSDENKTILEKAREILTEPTEIRENEIREN